MEYGTAVVASFESHGKGGVVSRTLLWIRCMDSVNMTYMYTKNIYLCTSIYGGAAVVTQVSVTGIQTAVPGTPRVEYEILRTAVE